MPNLNNSDILFLESPDFYALRVLLENLYGFKIIFYYLPPFISFTSRKAVLETESGTYFLKEKPLYCSNKRSRELAVDFQNFLSQTLKTVPAVLSTLDDNHYIQWSTRFFFLTEFKVGRVFNGSETDIEHILDALKNFQDASKKFDSASKFGLDNKKDSYHTLNFFPLLEKKAKTRAEKTNLKRIKHLISLLKKEYDTIPRTNYLISHGDFALFNILLDGKSVVSINDFDNVELFPRVHDLAEFLVSASLIHYLAPMSNLRLPVFFRPTENIFNKVLAFYARHLEISSEEIRLLAITSEIIWLEILLLAVLKEDYTVFDILIAIKNIEQGYLRLRIQQTMHMLK
ncbi:phosphotransferase [Microcoleus sp. T2B6]|uniref:phosphotransferase n=1 Tax=Microcoleus sp. T2B6 TaxID=3055424 RepID=UPI002FD67B03